MNELFHVALEEISRRPPYPAPRSRLDHETMLGILRPVMRVVFGLGSLFLIICSVILLLQAPAAEGWEPKLLILAYLLVNVLSLSLVTRYSAGNLRLLPYPTILLVILGLGILLSYFTERHMSSLFVAAFIVVVVTPPVLILIVEMAAPNDTMSVSSPFFGLAYPGRYRHLKTLAEFGVSKGWVVTGPEGRDHTLEINGLMNGHELLISAGHRKHRTRPFPLKDYVLIRVGFQEEFLPFRVGNKVRESDNPPGVYQETYSAGKDEKNLWLVFGETGAEHARAASKSIIGILAANPSFAGKSAGVWTNEDFLEYRTGQMKLFERQETITALLYDLEKVGRIIQANG